MGNFIVNHLVWLDRPFASGVVCGFVFILASAGLRLLVGLL